MSNRFRSCFRRWAAGRPLAGVAAAAAAARALARLRAVAVRKRQVSLTGIVQWASDRRSRLQTRRALGLFRDAAAAAKLPPTGIGAAARLSRRAAVRRWRATAFATGRRRRGILALSLRARRSDCRRLLSAWVRFSFRVARGLRAAAAAAAQRAAEADEAAAGARAELGQLKAVRSLWGDDEMPAMLQALVRLKSPSPPPSGIPLTPSACGEMMRCRLWGDDEMPAMLQAL
eukprot:scaffold569_cov76-Isochrysis_galbana.AAC.1